MVRVLYWTQLFRPYVGGVEVLGAEYVRALNERGHRLAIVTSHGSLDLPDEDVLDGVPVHRFRFGEALARRDPRAILVAERRLATLKRAFAPDVVHLQLTDGSVFFHLRTADVHPAPSVVSIRVSLTDCESGPGSVLGRALRVASWVTANSAATLGQVRRLAPEVVPRSSLVYNGLPMPATAPTALPLDPPTLLCLGRLVADKGFDLAIRALAALRSRVPSVRLVVAGDGPARASLAEEAAALGVADAVEFAGWVPPERVPDLLNRATVVLMPSRWQEAFGLVALQAAQMARPVVATDVGGLPEIVRHGRTGLVVPPESPPAIADAVHVLLRDPGRARALGRAARVRARHVFGFARYVLAHEQLYDRLVGRLGHAAS